jgi:hypothetical protein
MVIIISIGVFLASFVDSIGGGGGIISVPAYLLAGLPAHLALGTNKLSACIGTAVSTGRFIKRGYVDWKLGLPSICLALLGSYFGTRLQLAVDERYLKWLLLLVLPVIAFFVLKQKKLPETRGGMNEKKRMAIVLIASLVVGTYDGFYGPGTGCFLILIFCNMAKLDLRTAAGNVKVVNLASNAGALFTSLINGKVFLALGLIGALFSVLGNYLGSGLVIKDGSKIIRPVILIVLTMLAVKVISEMI